MKLRKLILAAMPIATVATMAATMTSCNKNNNILNYTQAKEWVKTNYGETEQTFAKPTKTVSSWSFSGKVTRDGQKTTDDYYEYHRNHTINLFEILTLASGTTSIGQTYTHEKGSDSYIFTTKKDGTDNPITVDSIEEEAAKKKLDNPLSYANMDSIIYTYFGWTGRSDTKFIVDNNNKTLKAVGTLSSIWEQTLGYNAIKIPYFTLSFDSHGRFKDLNIDFGPYSQCLYIWYNKGTTKADFFEFTCQDKDFIHIEYKYS